MKLYIMGGGGIPQIGTSYYHVADNKIVHLRMEGWNNSVLCLTLERCTHLIMDRGMLHYNILSAEWRLKTMWNIE